MLVAAVLQALLVLGAVDHEQTMAAFLSARGVIGLWLLLVNLLDLTGAVLPGGLAVSGMVAGGGYILLVVGFRLGGQPHTLFYAGSGIAALGYTICGTWPGYLFLRGSLSSALCAGSARHCANKPYQACSAPTAHSRRL